MAGPTPERIHVPYTQSELTSIDIKRQPLFPRRDEQVEVRDEPCGFCHSDLSMFNRDRGWFRFPAIFGDEAISSVVEVGRTVKAFSALPTGVNP
jgi:Zn-dependent alcohol dehydrogenase